MRKKPIDGNLSLNQAVALLIQTQAAFVSEMREMHQRLDNNEREIRATLFRHEQILMRHEELLKELTGAISRLPEVIRQEIGFKAK